jgi:hypothetical protein
MQGRTNAWVSGYLPFHSCSFIFLHNHMQRSEFFPHFLSTLTWNNKQPHMSNFSIPPRTLPHMQALTHQKMESTLIPSSSPSSDHHTAITTPFPNQPKKNFTQWTNMQRRPKSMLPIVFILNQSTINTPPYLRNEIIKQSTQINTSKLLAFHFFMFLANLGFWVRSWSKVSGQLQSLAIEFKASIRWVL